VRVAAAQTPGGLGRFSSLTRGWFEGAFAAPTQAQVGAWDALASDQDVLVVAPTGSGKTLAAFLSAIDRLATAPPVPERQRLRVLYISPLKALAADIERNLRAPLAGLRAAAAGVDARLPDITVGMRTGDTPAEARRRFPAHPPDILITTPESLFLLLTSRAREALASVDTVIVDEVHSVVATKRGAHLALSLERLDELLERPARRIGLSATVRPLDEVARFLGGSRPVTVVAPPSEKAFDLSVVVPVEDMTTIGSSDENFDASAAQPPSASIWPHIDERLVELIRAHRSTIVFANSRRLAERLCANLNELAGTELARAHHGSVSREQRTEIEEDLKAGRLPAVVATSSLELGIDMGAVDLVVQVEAPSSVASGLQRIGRAGHQVGAVSRGVVFPKFRGDLVESAVVVERMRAGAIEAMRYPRNPLDVLAQQVVAMVAMDDWTVDDLEALVRRAAPFAELPRSALDSVLDMLSGRYPSDEFAELRPRLNWDRVEGRLSGRPGAQRLAVTSGGTIPDRGLFGVFLVGERATRVGELDEEMVYESRVGEVFTLGASAWRIEDITHDRVLVSPAPGQPGKLPFWHGDMLGRPVELGRALGAFLRELGGLAPEARTERLPPATWPPTWTSSARPPGSCPTTAPSWSNASATSWATGGSASTRRSGPRSTPPGPRPSRPGSASASASRSRPCTPTTGWWCGSPRSTRPRRPSRSCSTPTRSRTWWWGRSAPRPCSPAASASARPGPCCCPGAGPTGARRCGSSASAAPGCSRSPPGTGRSRWCWRRCASASRTCSTCPASRT
jgi:ATP-dependent Lhr-like helicase